MADSLTSTDPRVLPGWFILQWRLGKGWSFKWNPISRENEAAATAISALDEIKNRSHRYKHCET